MKTWTKASALALALVGAGFVVNAATDHSQAETADIGTGQKLCSGVEGGHWRDTINVPDSATLPTCMSFQKSIGVSSVQLGCIFSTGEVTWGVIGGAAPVPNCGW